MNTRHLLKSVGFTVLLLIFITRLVTAQAPEASPLGAGFTYQGQLNSSGNPYTGLCDFQFGLWDSLTDGSQVGSTLTEANVNLMDGNFTVQLDFGTSAFQGDALWIDVEVRCPAGSGEYSQLTPRQPITSAPYALFARAADPTIMQRRVMGTCSSGSAIRVVNQDGTVTCEPLNVNAWQLSGNTGTIPGTNYLGTSDNASLELKVNDLRVLRLEPNDTSPNLIGGYHGNQLTSGVYGAVIGGGGKSSELNRVTDTFGTVGGGAGNQAGNDNTDLSDASYSTISGGYENTITDTYGTISGGAGNKVIGLYGVVAGGGSNMVLEDSGTIGGGTSNQVSGSSGTIGGGFANGAYGIGDTIGAGWYNSTMGEFGTIGGGYDNDAFAPYSTISGGKDNTITDTYGTIGGGAGNKVIGLYGVVAGGGSNMVLEDTGTIGGGTSNQVSGGSGTIGGGYANGAFGMGGTIGAGWFNHTTGEFGTIGGGYDNDAFAPYSTISGGKENTITDTYGTIGGGLQNIITNTYGTIGGGYQNSVSGSNSTIGGGGYNSVTAAFGTIAGGGSSDVISPSTTSNRVTDPYGTISGGGNNQAGDNDSFSDNAMYATIGGGTQNAADCFASTISGGYDNHACSYASIGGGNQNNASGKESTIGGGYSNEATAASTTIGGGWNNTASNNSATVPGGASNTASGGYSFAAGAVATASHAGSFVWSSGEATSSWGDRTFTARAHGGVRIYTSSGTGTYASLAPGSGTWSAVSDRNLKENLQLVNAREILVLLSEVPMSTWNYTTQDPAIRHIGPMAQDFYSAFGVGEDDTHITTIDADGVALAAIQGLYAENQELKAQLQDIETRLNALEAATGDIKSNSTSNPISLPWLLIGGMVFAGSGALAGFKSRNGVG